MKITPTQDEDVIEQTIELPKPDTTLEDYILLGYSEHDLGKTEQIPPDKVIKQTSFYLSEGVRLVIESVSKNLKISRSKTTEFLTKCGMGYLDYLNTKYSNLEKCSTLLKEIAETNLETTVGRARDAFLHEVEKKLDYSVDKKGVQKTSVRLIWWVDEGIGRLSHKLCLERTDVFTILIYYSAYFCKNPLSLSLKNKCKSALINLEKSLSIYNNTIIDSLSESTKKNIVGVLAVEGKEKEIEYKELINKIKESYPQVYEDNISPVINKERDTVAIENKEISINGVDIQNKDKEQAIEPVSKTIVLIANLVDQGKMLEFDVVLADESMLSYKRKRKNNKKNIKINK